VHGDGKQHWQGVNGDGLNQLSNIHGLIVSEGLAVTSQALPAGHAPGE